ncbi:hypothetical protein DSO57_1010276 [Entomophthora muscae]|uniref:Uncharacterized protein n=1 Tax=Entomophthora muscae TaxID=34485 RepID=A0ACC2T6E6_9FUNG|nr:hypothetical protein DSO57_1010276 [Entomophthora muscae]
MDESRPLLEGVQRTSLPWLQVAILLVVRLADPLSFTVLFPFVYFMVRDFQVAKNEAHIGFYVGIIASSFATAQMLSGIPWGMISDRVGRRPVILVGLFGTSISLLMFGLSTSLPWAIATRCMCGLLSGNVGVIKSAMAELTNASNRAQAFSLLPLAGGFGAILGPILGGFFSDPVTKYPFLDGQGFVGKLLLRFPYLLPCAICSLVIGLAAVSGIFFFKETHVFADENKQHVRNDAIPHQCKMAIVCFTAQSFQKVIHNELFPMWAATSVAKGGLGFSASEIGAIMSFCGISLLVIQPIMYKPLNSYMGTLLLYQSCFLISIAVILLFPATALLASSSWSYLLWPSLLALAAIRTAYSVFSATSINLFLADICPHHTLGKVNGVSQATTSFARAIGPVLCGAIYSHSLESSSLLGAPLMWFLLAVVAFVNYCLSLILTH